MENNPSRVVILGGGYGGMMAINRLLRSNVPIALTLIDPKPAFEQRIRFHQALTGEQVTDLNYRDALENKGVTILTGLATSLDLASREVSVSGEDGQRKVQYDYLVYAPGSQILAPDIPGARHLVRFNTAAEANAAGNQLARWKDVTVVGGGLTGIEISTEIAARYPSHRITLIAGTSPFAGLSEAASKHLETTFDQLGIILRTGNRVSSVCKTGISLDNDDIILHDGCIWAGGFQVPTLGRDSGLATDAEGRVLTRPSLQSVSDDRIFAIGDAACVRDGRGNSFRMGCVNALPQGVHAGENLRALLEGRPMTGYSMGYAFRCLSLGRNNGLIQFTDAFDAAKPKVWTHRTGALTKEAICRMTFAAVKWELRTGLSLYSWPRSPSEQSGVTELQGR